MAQRIETHEEQQCALGEECFELYPEVKEGKTKSSEISPRNITYCQVLEPKNKNELRFKCVSKGDRLAEQMTREERV